MNKLLILFMLFCSCFQLESGKEQQRKSDNILIVYLSRTNNTKVVAEMIQEQMGGSLVPLEMVNPYPEDYKEIVAQVQRENETGFLPPLKTKLDMAQYDTVFLGFPTWGMQLPPPMKSFLVHNNIKGKTIIPFNTNAGYGFGSSIKTIRKLSPNSTILEVFSIKGGIERDGVYLAIKGDKAVEAKSEIKQWLLKIGVLQ